MSDEDQLIKRFLSVSEDFKVVASIRVQEHLPTKQTTMELSAELELRNNDLRNERRLLLTFKGVTSLKILQPEWSQFEISQMRIRSIRERQWERLNYEVVSNEISLLCDKFDVQILENQ